jgi:hypothetical protein
MKSFFFFLFISTVAWVNAQSVFDVPYSTDFENYTSEEEFLADWKYENNLPTDQAGVWGFDYTAYFGYNSSNCPFYFTASSSDGDDWLFSPGFNLAAGTNYDLSFLYAGAFAGYTEKMVVYIGNADTSSAMNTELYNFTSITNDQFQNSSIVFSVPDTGVYYIGFFANSVADNFGILIDNFSLGLQTGINQFNKNAIQVYPNPCGGLLHVTTGNSFFWSLYSPEGTAIVLNQVSEGTTVDLSAYAHGLYFLKINGNEAVPVVLNR